MQRSPDSLAGFKGGEGRTWVMVEGMEGKRENGEGRGKGGSWG